MGDRGRHEHEQAIVEYQPERAATEHKQVAAESAHRIPPVFVLIFVFVFIPLGFHGATGGPFGLTTICTDAPVVLVVLVIILATASNSISQLIGGQATTPPPPIARC